MKTNDYKVVKKTIEGRITVTIKCNQDDSARVFNSYWEFDRFRV